MFHNCTKASQFWQVGDNYLHLVQAVLDKNNEQGNALGVTKQGSIPDEQELAEGTLWSDFNVAIPLLFNFFHGLEVILKGFRLVKGLDGRRSHKLSDLLSDFKSQYSGEDLIPLFEKYIVKENLPSILREFCATSEITIDEYYQALKYPESMKEKQYQHNTLMYKGSKGAAFFGELNNDIGKIRKKTLSLGRNICPGI